MVFGAGRVFFGVTFQAEKFALVFDAQSRYNSCSSRENNIMQQILQQLQHGTKEVVKDNGDGTLTMKDVPPTSLMLRTARLIIQIANERDQVVNSNIQLNAQLHHLLEENSRLNTQLKELNDRLNSSTVPSADTSTPNPSDRGVDSVGKDETPGSEAS